MALSTDPNDLGTDISLLTDLTSVWGLASGPTNLIDALLRRLSTPREGLFYDPDYGYDLMSQVNSAITEADLETMNGSIVDEVRKDQRVRSATVALAFTFATKTLQIAISIETADGPFDLVLAASAITVELLSINGIAQQAATTTDTANVIVGPPGPQGPAGPAGATGGGGGGGTPQLVLDDPRTLASSTGTEEVLYQWDGVDFGALTAGSLTGEVMASALSASGTATYRLRLGGSDGAADGTVICSFTHALASFQTKNASGSFTNPTGLLYVKLTAQSSGAAVDARLKGPVVTFR